MISRLLCCLLILCPVTIAHAIGRDILVNLRVIAMPKDDANAFLSSTKLEVLPKQVIADMLKRIDEKRAALLVQSSLRTFSAQKSKAEGNSVLVECEAILSPDDYVVIQLSAECRQASTGTKPKITITSVMQRDTTRLIGAADEAGDGRTLLFFVTIH